MTFQPCPGVAQMVVSCAGANQDEWQNVLHFGKNDGSGFTTSELTSLVNSFDTWMGTTNGAKAMLKYLTTAHSITKILARDLTVDGGSEYGKVVAHPGTDTGEPLNSGLSFAITLRTGFAGRSYRGRIFKYGLTDTTCGSFAPDGVDVAVADDMVAGYADLITVSAGWSPAMKWGVLSRYHNKVERTNGVITPIASIGYSQLVLDFQRRRAPLHARHH